MLLSRAQMSAVASSAAMTTDVKSLQAKVMILETENRRLTSNLTKQANESRRRSEGIQGELARVQHLCNELTFAMVMHGVDPTALSAVVRDSHRFDVGAVLSARTPERADRAAAGGAISGDNNIAAAATSGLSASIGAADLGHLNSLALQGLGPAQVNLPSGSYQLAPPTIPARFGTPTHHRRLHASPPDAYIPDALLKRLDASSALVQRLGSPATWDRSGTPTNNKQHSHRSRSALGMAFDATNNVSGAGGGVGVVPASLEWPNGAEGEGLCPTPPPGSRPRSQLNDSSMAEPGGTPGGGAGDSGGRRGRRLMHADGSNDHPPPAAARVAGGVGGA